MTGAEWESLGLYHGHRYEFRCVGADAPYLGYVERVVATSQGVPIAIHLDSGPILNWSNVVSYEGMSS